VCYLFCQFLFSLHRRLTNSILSFTSGWKAFDLIDDDDSGYITKSVSFPLCILHTCVIVNEILIASTLLSFIYLLGPSQAVGTSRTSIASR
jgi:hypothetical protein